MWEQLQWLAAWGLPHITPSSTSLSSLIVANYTKSNYCLSVIVKLYFSVLAQREKDKKQFKVKETQERDNNWWFSVAVTSTNPKSNDDIVLIHSIVLFPRRCCSSYSQLEFEKTACILWDHQHNPRSHNQHSHNYHDWLSKIRIILRELRIMEISLGPVLEVSWSF